MTVDEPEAEQADGEWKRDRLKKGRRSIGSTESGQQIPEPKRQARKGMEVDT